MIVPACRITTLQSMSAWVLSACMLSSLPFQALIGQTATTGILRGRVLDSASGKPLAGATIQLLKASKAAPFAGTVSNAEGFFRFESAPGAYAVIVEFTGYRSFKSASLRISTGQPKDLVSILLVPETVQLQEVIVRAEKSSIQLSLDKRIFNVGMDLANAGGNTLDVLMNIPSVSVDPEGTVRLRGSDNVRILIDGKPSGLVSIKGGSGLNNLPASLVERVEVITNPSSRYEAEGNAGVINIVLRKDKRQGFNGSLEVITGQPVNYGLAATPASRSTMDWQPTSTSVKTNSTFSLTTASPIASSPPKDASARSFPATIPSSSCSRRTKQNSLASTTISGPDSIISSPKKAYSPPPTFTDAARATGAATLPMRITYWLQQQYPGRTRLFLHRKKRTHRRLPLPTQPGQPAPQLYL